jgi:spoIIIJ-associated protein
MEWVETTAKTIDEAKERALDQLGVADDDAEFEILEEPKAGLFGLIRGEARLRARVRPTEARPKVERRRGRRSESKGSSAPGGTATGTVASDDQESDDTASNGDSGNARGGNGRRGGSEARRGRSRDDRPEPRRDDRDHDDQPVEPAAVGAAAVAFMEGLVEAFGLAATVELDIDGTELDVRVVGDDLGLLIGPGGRTLSAIQDLARVAAQRRLGDHETRLRIDVAGYRERRRAALERFAQTVAEQVLETSSPRSLEPMPSSDRKIVHDVLVDIAGVTSHSEGDDPYRRVVVTPE